MAIPESIKKLANDIRNKVYGREVRESLAKGIEEAGDLADKANTKSENAVYQVNNIQAQVNQLVIEGDSSVEAAQARVDADGNVFTTLKERLDTKEQSFSAQLAQIGDYTTVKSEGNSLSEKVQNEFNSRGYNVLWNASLALDGDWAPAIQASIDYVAAKGGGTVFIPEATFYIKSKIILKENVTLAGMSYKSIIKLADNTEIDYMLETQLIEDRYVYNINIHDLCFDGNRLNGAKSNGIMVYNTWQGNFEHLKLIDIGGTAFTLYGKGHGASTNWLKNSIITYNEGYGVLVDADKDENGNLLALNGDFHIDGCDIGMNGYSGVVFYPSACSIKNSVVWMNGQKQINNNACGIQTKSTADLIEIKNCQIEGNKQNGIEIYGSHNNIVGNRIFANSQQEDWGYYGVAVNYTAKGTNIKDNKILSGVDVAGLQRSIYNGGTYTDIKDNDLIFMHHGDVKLDIDPVEYTDIAFTTMNYDYNHITTDIEYGLSQAFTTTGGTIEVLKFDARLRDSFLEYNTVDGTFKPRFTGYYVFTFNVFLVPTTETDVQIFVDGKTLFKEYIDKGRAVTITTPPIYITKDQTRNISIYTSSSLTVDPISTLRIYKA